MDLIDIIKVKAAENRYSLSSLSDEYNKRYGTNISRESFFRKLKTETIKQKEYERILEILGYRIKWEKIE